MLQQIPQASSHHPKKHQTDELKLALHKHRWRLKSKPYVLILCSQQSNRSNATPKACYAFAQHSLVRNLNLTDHHKITRNYTVYLRSNTHNSDERLWANRQNGTMVFTFIHNEGKLNLNHMIINYNTMIYLFMI